MYFAGSDTSRAWFNQPGLIFSCQARFAAVGCPDRDPNGGTQPVGYWLHFISIPVSADNNIILLTGVISSVNGTWYLGTYLVN